MRSSDRISNSSLRMLEIKKEEDEVEAVLEEEEKLEMNRFLGLYQKGQIFSNNTELSELAKAFGLSDSYDYTHLPSRVSSDRYSNPRVISLSK